MMESLKIKGKELKRRESTVLQDFFRLRCVFMHRNQPYCSIADGYQHIVLKSEGVRDLNLCPMNWRGLSGLAVQRLCKHVS